MLLFESITLYILLVVLIIQIRYQQRFFNFQQFSLGTDAYTFLYDVNMTFSGLAGRSVSSSIACSAPGVVVCMRLHV